MCYIAFHIDRNIAILCHGMCECKTNQAAVQLVHIISLYQEVEVSGRLQFTEAFECPYRAMKAKKVTYFWISTHLHIITYLLYLCHKKCKIVVGLCIPMHLNIV